MKNLFFITMALMSHFTALCQPDTSTGLRGRITDVVTGKPLEGASVILSDLRTGTITDSSGYFYFRNIPTGHTIIEISYTGYRTSVEHIDISENDTFDFVLIPSILENEGVTITAVANATSIRQAPIQITRMTKSRLLAAPSTNIIDALARQPGVNQLSSGPAISKPIIRGLGYNRLIVINDGVRQEGQQWGDEHGIEIDENSVSRVEIVKGPASLIYGSDALAGVINIITTNPVPVNTFKGSIVSNYQTNNRQHSLFGNLGANKNGFSWNVWADYKAAGDYQNRYDGMVYNSKFNEKNFGGYVGWNGSWGFSHFIVSRFNQKLGVIEGERMPGGQFVKVLPGGMETIPTVEDHRITEPQIPFQHVRHLKLISDNSFKAGSGRITMNLGWQRNQREEFGNPDAEVSDLYFDLNTLSYAAAYHFNDKNEWTTTVGINGMWQNNQNKADEVLIPEYSLFDAGAFVYSKKSWHRTTFSGGLRFDVRSLRTKYFTDNGNLKFPSIQRSFSNVAASAGISFDATDNVVLKLNLAKGFRAPSIPELSSNGTHEGTNRYEYGNNELQSEKSLQADAGIEANSEHISVIASIFYNRINDFIFISKLKGVNNSDSLVDVGGEWIPAYQFGQNNARLYGFELVTDLHPHPLDWLHWQNTISYVRGNFQQSVGGDKDLPSIPAARWISELRGELLTKGKMIRNLMLYVEADKSFAQRNAFTAFDTETFTNGYTLFNAGASADVVSNSKTLFQLYIIVTNLGNVAYQSHLSRLKYADINPVTTRRGVFNMGRNISLKLHIPF